MLRLRDGDRAAFDEILAPTVPLSRHVFCAPTRYYKTGVVFIAWLNGHQRHFVMVGGQQSARNLLHLVELFRLADVAGVLGDPDLACERMRTLLAFHGVDVNDERRRAAPRRESRPPLGAIAQRRCRAASVGVHQ